MSSVAQRICASVIVSVPPSGGGSFGSSSIKTRVVYGQGLVSLCDLSLEMGGMWEEGSSSNKAVEIGAAGYTAIYRQECWCVSEQITPHSFQWGRGAWRFYQFILSTSLQNLSWKLARRWIPDSQGKKKKGAQTN